VRDYDGLDRIGDLHFLNRTLHLPPPRRGYTGADDRFGPREWAGRTPVCSSRRRRAKSRMRPLRRSLAMKVALSLLMILALAVATRVAADAQPPASRVEPVTDTLHGQTI